jgi:hypothetical protein
LRTGRVSRKHGLAFVLPDLARLLAQLTRSATFGRLTM